MRLWVIILAYAVTNFGCVTDKGRKLGGTSNETYRSLSEYQTDYGVTGD
jgi:hypothetical protein